MKLIWLALRNIMSDRGRSVRQWQEAMHQFALAYGDASIRARPWRSIDESGCVRMQHRLDQRAGRPSSSAPASKDKSISAPHTKFPTRPETADFEGGETLIEAVPEGALVIADRAFDSDRPQGAIEAPAAVPRTEAVLRTHPAEGKASLEDLPRPKPPPLSNAIERMFCRLKDLSCVATRYDRLAGTCCAGNYLAAVRDRRSTEGHSPAIAAFRS